MITTLYLLTLAAAEGEVLGYLELRGYGLWGQADDLSRLAQPPFNLDFARAGIDPDEHWAGMARLRPTGKLHLNEDSTLVATALAEGRDGFFSEDPDRIEDVVSVERLYVTLGRGEVDVVAGKQLIAWGSGLLTNPTDVFTQKPVNDLTAELPGVWAARATWGIDPESNLHLAAAVSEARCCDATLLARYDRTLGSTDGALVAAWLNGSEQYLLGLDVKGELELGLWAEAAVVFDRSDDPRKEWFLLAEVGADYSLADLYVAVEWIHQGDGIGGEWRGPRDNPPDYSGASFLGDDPSQRPLLGTNYALLLARYTATTTLTAQWLNLLNIRDPSGTSVLQAIWRPGEVLEFTLGGQLNWGEPGGEFNQRTPDNPFLPPELRNARLQPRVIAWLWSRAHF